MENIEEARSKVFQMFGAAGLQMFEEAIRYKSGTLVIEENRVLLYENTGNLIFRAGERHPSEIK